MLTYQHFLYLVTFFFFSKPHVLSLEYGDEIIWKDTKVRVPSGREIAAFEVQILTPCDPEELANRLGIVHIGKRNERARAFCLKFIEQKFEQALFDACDSPPRTFLPRRSKRYILSLTSYLLSIHAL